jgi:hypothetical protein
VVHSLTCASLLNTATLPISSMLTSTAKRQMVVTSEQGLRYSQPETADDAAMPGAEESMKNLGRRSNIN